MGKINLTGKKIRLFFDQDLDGSIAASLISLFSGAKVVKYLPAFAVQTEPRKQNVFIVIQHLLNNNNNNNNNN